MSFLDDVRAERLQKIELVRESGMDPYPAESNRTHTNALFLESFETLILSEESVTLAGRIMALRNQGGISFVDIFDGTERVQILLTKKSLGAESSDLFDSTVDTGDFIEIVGKSITTKRGTNSVEAQSWRLLAKSVRPMPDEWFGIKDDDERYRRRYIDILLNPELSELLKKRSLFWNAIRTFMLESNFV